MRVETEKIVGVVVEQSVFQVVSRDTPPRVDEGRLEVAVVMPAPEPIVVRTIRQEHLVFAEGEEVRVIILGE